MTTPLPLGLAPYLSPLTLLTAPTGVDFSTIPPGDDVTPAQNMAELWNMCGRATSRTDAYCNQVLRATTDIELCRGPDFRVTVGPASGGALPTPYWGNSPAQNARLIMSRWPILQVNAVQTCPNGLWPRQWSTLPTGYAEPEKPRSASMVPLPRPVTHRAARRSSSAAGTSTGSTAGTAGPSRSAT